MPRKPITQQTHRPSISAEVICDMDSFEDLKTFWDQTGSDPMNGYDWNHAWWNAFQANGQLHTIRFYDGNETVGVLPLYLDRWFGVERLRFIGSGKTCTDYVDFIANPDERQQLSQCLVDHLREQQFSVVELECTRDDVLSREVADALSDEYTVSCRDEDPIWVLELCDDWEEFVKQSHRGLRRKIRKGIKCIQSGQLEVKSTSDGLAVEDALDTFKKLHQLRLESKSEPGVFADPQYESFFFDAFTRLCRTGQAEIVQLRQDGDCVGTQVHLVAKNGYQFYQSGYSPEHMKLEPGHVLFTEMIKRGIALGHTEFDFLRGNESYKAFWGATVRPLKKFRLVSQNPYTAVLGQVVDVVKTLKAFTQRNNEEKAKREAPIR